jgi:hypothetical protein
MALLFLNGSVRFRLLNVIMLFCLIPHEHTLSFILKMLFTRNVLVCRKTIPNGYIFYNSEVFHCIMTGQNQLRLTENK